MHPLLQGESGRKSCVYIALDALLGNEWDKEGRDFLAGIIKEFNGYPSRFNHVLEELAPVVVWGEIARVSYEQPEPYVRLYNQGWRYRIYKNTQVCVSYIYDNGYEDVAHMTCIPIRSIFELNFKSLIALVIKRGTTIIRDKE